MYDLFTINGEAFYVCDKGSDYSRDGERLILRYDVFPDGSTSWTAYDGGLVQDGSQFGCRQAVFRIQNEKKTYPGTYNWDMNVKANARNGGSDTPEWDGPLKAETKVRTH